MTRVDVAPGTLVVFADLGCQWAVVALHRLHTTRRRLGFDAAVAIDVRVFPLELVNERPTPFAGVQGEIPAMQRLVPEAGFRLWPADPTTWPVTVLPPMEAVEAVKAQGLEASAQLDLELRRALFAGGECISMRHVILDVAARCPLVDAGELAAALDDGRARRSMLAAYAAAGDAVRGSPHVFLADGTDAHNPGVAFHWDRRARTVVIDEDDPSIYEDLLRRVVATAAA